MTRRLALAAIATALLLTGPGLWALGPSGAGLGTAHTAPRTDLGADLDAIFADPVLARALVGIRVESLRDGRVI